jgi:hypothetical protein
MACSDNTGNSLFTKIQNRNSVSSLNLSFIVRSAWNQRDPSHHCTPSTARAVTPPNVGVTPAVPCIIRSFIICTFHHSYEDDQVNQKEVCDACVLYGIDYICAQNCT